MMNVSSSFEFCFCQFAQPVSFWNEAILMTIQVTMPPTFCAFLIVMHSRAAPQIMSDSRTTKLYLRRPT